MNRPITYKRSLKAKNLYIKIKPFNDVLVSVPFFMSKSEAQNFVKSKNGWIQKKLLDIVEIESLHNRSLAGYKTRFSTVVFKITSASRASFRLIENEISIFVPAHLDENEKSIRKCTHRAINKALLLEAKKILPYRVEELAKKYNLLYKSLNIKYTKTRWGSCSGKNDIILNPHLLRLKDELIDYVILHELAHTKVKSHNKFFWLTLQKLSVKAKEHDKELKKYSLQYL